MTGEEYRDTIRELGLSQSAAGRLVRATDRSSRRWVNDGPPPMVAMILRMMKATGLKPADVDALMAPDEQREPVHG